MDGKDGGINNTKRGDMAFRPHVGFTTEGFVTEARFDRAKSLAFDYFTHDFRGSPCLTATAAYFGVRKYLHFMHFSKDFVRAMRKGGFTIRQRNSIIRNSGYDVQSFVTVVNGEMSQTQIKQLLHEGELPSHFIFIVKGHIFATDYTGRVVVDTAPHKGATDDRVVYTVYGVW